MPRAKVFHANCKNAKRHKKKACFTNKRNLANGYWRKKYRRTLFFQYKNIFFTKGTDEVWQEMGVSRRKNAEVWQETDAILAVKAPKCGKKATHYQQQKSRNNKKLRRQILGNEQVCYKFFARRAAAQRRCGFSKQTVTFSFWFSFRAGLRQVAFPPLALRKRFGAVCSLLAECGRQFVLRKVWC